MSVIGQFMVVLDTTKVQIFKQITTSILRYISVKTLFQIPQRYRFSSKSQRPHYHAIIWFGCFRYHKGTDFQANHNGAFDNIYKGRVVLDTTKVQIFKQITTSSGRGTTLHQLFQIPQRYRFSSKSQLCSPLTAINISCFRYHKGTDFQANHNANLQKETSGLVVLDTTKVQIFKQITTTLLLGSPGIQLFQIPQRYRFSSKSQLFYVLVKY